MIHTLIDTYFICGFRPLRYLLQIIFDGFSVGRFDEGLIDSDSDSSDMSLSSFGDLPGCPEGFMQVIRWNGRE